MPQRLKLPLPRLRRASSCWRRPCARCFPAPRAQRNVPGECWLMDKLDIYRCAKLLLDQHGRDAGLQAAMRADALDAAGDEAGRRARMRILAAVDELARTERRRDEPQQ